MTRPLPPTDLSALLYAVQSGAFCFDDVISFIDDHYRYTPTAFTNGTLSNAAGTSEGSCKVFGFAKLHNLSQKDTLSLFCEHYKAVLTHPNGIDHPNIREFLHWGWQAFAMPTSPLVVRA